MRWLLGTPERSLHSSGVLDADAATLSAIRITSLVWFIILGIYVMYDRWPRPEVIVIRDSCSERCSNLETLLYISPGRL